MKSIPILILSLLLLVNPSTQAQLNKQLRITPVPLGQDEPQPKFDIDFPGGTPQQLIDAINKQPGIHVNAIIPSESASYAIPALKMNGVTLSDLFLAMRNASSKTVNVLDGVMTDPNGGTSDHYQLRNENAGFQNVGNVWYFVWERALSRQEIKPKLCRYYQLGPYLKNRKVEDITTAVQTGWKMLGETNLPELKFHQETQMLIAVGEGNQLKLIDSVLQQLRFDSAPSNAAPGLPFLKPATNAPGR